MKTLPLKDFPKVLVNHRREITPGVIEEVDYVINIIFKDGSFTDICLEGRYRFHIDDFNPVHKALVVTSKRRYNKGAVAMGVVLETIVEEYS